MVNPGGTELPYGSVTLTVHGKVETLTRASWLLVQKYYHLYNQFSVESLYKSHRWGKVTVKMPISRPLLKQKFWFSRSRVRCRKTTFNGRATIYDSVISKCQNTFNIWFKKRQVSIQWNQSHEDYLDVIRRKDNPGTEQTKLWRWLHLLMKRFTLGLQSR